MELANIFPVFNALTTRLQPAAKFTDRETDHTKIRKRPLESIFSLNARCLIKK